MSATLEPCPFCGARLVESPTLANRTQRVFCHPPAEEICIAESVVIWVPSERVAKWNTRSADTGSGEESGT